jgi:hypothetical protein
VKGLARCAHLTLADNDKAHLPLWSASGIAVRCSALLAPLLLRNIFIEQLPDHFLILHMMLSRRFLEEIDTF